MGNNEKAALKRLGRGAAAVGISVGLGLLSNEPKMVFLAPLLNALAKYLRDIFNLSNIPI